MRKYSFKLFSSNVQNNPNLVIQGLDFVRKNADRMFVELMVVPQTPKEDIDTFAELAKGVEVRIHAPHNVMGFDAGDKSKEKENCQILSSSQYAADVLQSKTIVVHAGCGHGIEYLKETARQFKIFNDKRIVVENLPLYASDDAPLHGTTAEEIKYIQEESGCGFCLDFSHATCSANALNKDTEKHLSDFFALKPDVYHICDGDIKSVEDKHLHFGEGNYPLAHYLNDFTGENAYITMETGYGRPENIDKWVADFNYIINLERGE